MRLLLHIGTEKTGTTAVQQWLHRNDAQLKQDGIWYARCLGRPANRWIAVYARDGNHPDDGFIEAGLDSLDAHAAFARRIESEIRMEIEMARSHHCRVFIVSSEHMHSRLIHSRTVARLGQLFLPRFKEIEVLCYVRPQAELLQSRLSVSVRNMSIGFKDIEQLKERSYYDYHALWERWSSVFDQVTFIPWKRRPDVVRDISGRMGLDLGRYAEPARANGRLDYRAALLVFNIGNSSAARRAPELARRVFHDELPMEEPLRIPRDLARRANELFRDSNEALIRVCPELTMADLEVNLDDFPEDGNVFAALTRWDAAEHLGYLIVRLNAELELERTRTQLAKAERALVVRRLDNLRRWLTKARVHLATARGAHIDQVDEVIATLEERIAKLELEGDRLARSIK